MGLLSSLPRLDQWERRRMVSIDGMPPDLLELPRGRPFVLPCPYVIDRCWEENLWLEEVAPHHRIARWVDVTTGRPRRTGTDKCCSSSRIPTPP
jgi:oligopeptide transport system ATP-binding protein